MSKVRSVLPLAFQLNNRNPRNLERLTIARKPAGYHLDNPGRSFWHRLVLNETGRHVTAKIEHYLNGPVIQASTSEWAIKKQLYSNKDVSAYINVARVLADRCLKFGITEIRCDLKQNEALKIDLFLKHLTEGGVHLREPYRYKHANPWDKYRFQKPWEVTE